MTARRVAALIALPSAFVLAACTSSSTSGKGGTTSSTAPSGASQAAGSSASTGSAAAAAALGRRMQAAVVKIKSAHIDLDIVAAGQTLHGSGDEKLSGGKLVAMDITEALPGSTGTIRLIIVSGKTYAKLPASLNTSGKPYVLVSPNSSNATVRQLASSLGTALSSASLGSVSGFITAARSVQSRGTQTVNGIETTHYSVVVDVAKLPASLPGKDALTASGLTTLPLELYIDKQGRPVQVTEKLTVQGQTVASTVSVKNYDQPVSISAPPASQVSTS